MRVWDPRTGTKTMKLRGHTDNIRVLLLDSTGRSVEEVPIKLNLKYQYRHGNSHLIPIDCGKKLNDFAKDNSSL